MAYIGREPQIGNFQVCDAISVVNNQAAYTMQVSSVNVIPETANHCLVSLNGILQAPGSSFTVAGSTITFASALVTNDVINFIQILGSVLDLGVPSDDTVSIAKLTATGTKNSTTFLRGDNTFAAAGGGKILQVVSTTKTDTYTQSVNASTYASNNIPSLEPQITCSATSSKVLVMVTLAASMSATGAIAMGLFRGSTQIDLGNASSNRGRASKGMIYNHETSYLCMISTIFLDSPGSTSQLTYGVRLGHTSSSAKTIYVNRDHSYSDTAFRFPTSTASITLMEIGA